MKRAMYRVLLLLHPAAFRKQFAEEMLCVFDEAASEQCSSGYCLSAAGSLLRHWLRHPTPWKFAGGLTGGVLTILWAVGVPPLHVRNAPLSADILLLVTMVVLIAISLILLLTVSVFHSMRRRM